MLFAPLNNPISLHFLKIFRNLENFDLIHVHNEHSFFSFMSIIYNLVYKKPTVLTCHGQLRFGSSAEDVFEGIYTRSIGRSIFSIVDKIVTLSKADKDYLASFGASKNKIEVLPNAIDIDYLNGEVNKEAPKKDKLKEKFSHKKIMLFVGRIIKRKGIHYLIKSIPDVIKAHKDILYVLIGNGEYKGQAEELTKNLNLGDYVLFLGSLPQEMVFKYYQAADAFVLPSISEGCPTTLLEAMYFGLPVIATNIPGVYEHFKEVAILVSPGDENELASAIIRLFEDEQLSQRLSREGKKLVETKYTWDRLAKRYEEIYSDLVSSHSGCN
ncbi:2-deoxystreptamine glucosyltransferase [subsurface metagenome]